MREMAIARPFLRFGAVLLVLSALQSSCAFSLGPKLGLKPCGALGGNTAMARGRTRALNSVVAHPLRTSTLGLRMRAEKDSDAEPSSGSELVWSRRALVQASILAATASAINPTTRTFEPFVPSAHAESVEEIGMGYAKQYNRAPGKLVLFPDGKVETSPSDTRKYRALTLPNGMRVVLVSDPQTDTAGAALDVHVGHYSDPDDIPGLAHFCEHMIFLGTEKYPAEGELEDFLSRHGGSSNAYTDIEDTCYFFSINQDSLKPALDRFSQFFVSPLFTADGVDRELNAIESENAKNLQTDARRLDQLFRLRSNQEHPFAKFGTGNKLTLKENTQAKGIDLRKALLEFHDRYYSANMMTLSVCGREDLDTLQSWVTGMFAAVPNKDVPPPEALWAGKIKPFPDDAPKVAYNAVPVSDERSLSISWVLPYTSLEQKKQIDLAKPSSAVASILGSEGKGSLLQYLKTEKGLVTSLGAAVLDDSADLQIFGVVVDLTEEGLAKKEEVIETIFGYLDVVRKTGIPDYTFKEVETLAQINWKYRENVEPGNLVTLLAANMQGWDDPALYLSGPALIKAANKGLSAELLSQLTKEKALVTYIAKDFKPQAKEQEKWYKTQYFVDSVAEWKAAGLSSSLQIPPPNPFIPSNFDLVAKPTENLRTMPKGPDMILDNDQWRVHYKPDNRYGQPKAVAFFQFSQPDELFGSATNPKTSARARLLKFSLADALNEYTYDASVAGLQYSCDFSTRGARITFGGYNDKLPAFVESVSKAIATHLPDDQKKLDRYKDIIKRELKSFENAQPYQHAVQFAQLCTQLPGYLPPEVIPEVDKVTLEELRTWTANLWKDAFSECLIQGNLREDEAKQVVQAVNSAFKFKTVAEDKKAAPKLVKLPVVKEGWGSVLRNDEPNPSNPNSGILVAFQNANKDDLQQQMAMEVISSLIDQPFYGNLRTKQQLGYIVFAGAKQSEGVRNLNFVVQSSVADADYLTERVFEFIDGFTSVIEKLPEEQFVGYVKGLIERKLETPKKLTAEAIDHWDKIVPQKYTYDRDRKEAEALAKVTKEYVLQVWRDTILPGGAERRVITSQVFSQNFKGKTAKNANPLPKGSVLITNPKEFIAKNSVFPKEKGTPPGVLDSGNWLQA